MRVELPQAAQLPVDANKTREATPVVNPASQNHQPQDIQNETEDGYPSFSSFGSGGTYSLVSLKAAAARQERYFAVAESNIMASQSVSSIPDSLQRQFILLDGERKRRKTGESMEDFRQVALI
ncbi:MAG: hypothetical protein LBT74_04525 [Acidobacteriota bacterium]|jgi:hypothetical protein|nr:hypothetical protein [Acidobacteriota bacterium]